MYWNEFDYDVLKLDKKKTVNEILFWSVLL